MSTKKFEKLIDLIINEDQEAARALFHDIVVEKSRTIYESLIEDESSSLDDEISAEETGSMDDGEFVDDEEMSGDYDVDGEEGEFEVDDEEMGDMDDMGEEPAELEDRLVDVEDKLDQLMAEFEAQMGDDSEEVDVEDEEEVEELDEESTSTRDQHAERAGKKVTKDIEYDEKHDKLDEAIELKKIAGLYDGKISSDSPDGSKKGPVAANSGQKGMDSRPVNFDQGGQTATPTSTPKPSNYGTKGEGEVKDANQWENRPAGDAGKSAFTKKADRQYGQKDTDSGKLVGADGSIATDKRSPVPESRRTTKRRI
jgi:tetrahydromethanopterin S-methyltransferase subunit G